MVGNNQQQEKPQDFELIELLFQKVPSTGSNAADQLDKFFEARYQSLVDQIQSYLHSSEKPGFFPHRFLGSFSSVLDTKLNDKLGIKKLHFRFEGARTLKIVAETESKIHVFIFTEDIEAQHSKQTNTKNFEFTTGEWKNVMGRDYTPLDERKLQIDVIKILKDKYELVKSRPKSDKDVKSKKLHLYLKNNVLEYKAKDIYGNIQTMQIDSGELKGNDAFKNKFFDEIKQFLGKSGKDLSDDVRKELSRLTSVKGYTLKSGGEDEKINIKVESKKKIVDQPIEPTVKFQEVTKRLGKSVYLESYIEKLANPGAEIDQVQENLKAILNYIKKVHTNLDLQGNVYGIKAREADQHGFVAGIFDNFRYRDNTKLYLEQFAGGGYADIVLLVRGPNRAVGSVPILIELKAGTEGQVDPSDALRQAEDYIKGFRPNKMRVLTNADNAIAVGLNLDYTEPFKTEVKPVKQPSSPLMEKILTDIRDWDGSQHTRAQLEEQIKSALSSEYHTFPANKETKDHYYFSRDILGQSILINKIDQDQGNVKKYIYSYNEYPLNWPQGTEYTLSKSPVTTLIFVQGNEGQENTAFIFHIRESNTKEFYADKKIPVLNIPGIGGVKNVIEIKMSLKKYETGLSFEELFEIEQISKYNPSGADQQFTGSFLKIPNSDELKVKFDQAITSQHASDGEVSLQAYKALLSEVADMIYPIKDLITNEARLQAVLNGLLSSYSDLKLKETSTKQQDSAKTVIIPEFQVGAGGRVDMVIQGIGPSPQGTKEYTPIALEFKLIDKNLDEEGMKKEVDKLTKEQNVRYAKGAALKAITDSDKMFFMGVVVNVKAKDKNSLILTSDKFVPALVVHSSIFSISQQQCSKGRRTRSIGIPCIDSFDEEKITNEEKRKRVKELFGIESYDEKIITIDSPQVRIDGGKMNVKFKDNNGNDKELIIDNATNIKNIENYILDKKNLEIKLKASSDKEYAIIEGIKDQSSEYYLKIDDYRIKLDSIFQDGKEVIFDKLHQLSNDKQLLENKKCIEDIGDVQTNQDYNNIVEEIKQNLLAKGVREDTFDRFKSHFDDLGEKVFAGYISNVESSLKEKGIAFDRDKFDSAKIKGAKGGKFFSMMAIYDLLDSIGDTATLGRHNNDGLKQVFGINSILDAMDDVRKSVSISPNSKVGGLINKIPQPVRQAFVKIISNPVVQSITFATIAYQFGYSVNEIAQGNNHPLNYYWTASSGIKLASMSIRPISAGVSFTIKSVSATTKVLRGLSAAGKVLGRAAVVTIVADVLITIGVEIHERIEYTKAIAEQVPLLPGNEQAEVFFAGVIKLFTGRDVEKEYEDTIRIKGYLTYVKEAAIKLLNDNYDIDAVVQYVISIEEKYSEVIKNMGAQSICIMPSPNGPGCATQMKWICNLEKKYDNISFDKINTASNVKNDLSSLNISKTLPMKSYTLVMSEDWERFICDVKSSPQCHQGIDEKKVYIVNTDAKHIPHLTKYEYENLGLRIVNAPLRNPTQKSQCSTIINTKHTGNDAFAPCNSGKTYRNCQESFTLSGEPFIFTSPTIKDPSNTKKQTFPKGSVLYISGPKTLTAAANYPAVMHIPEGSNIRYIGSKNNETIFIINNSMSGTLKGGAGKENTLVMNVKANNIAANLHSGTIRYGNSNNIRLVNTYNYASNSDNKQNITTHCETRLINVKNAEVWQNSSNCTDKDYEVRVVNKENVHHRGLKQTVFIINENSDSARIVSDLGSTGKIKGNIDVISVQVANITQWGISEDIEKVGYSLDLLANDTQSIVSSTKIDDFKNLVIQVNCQGITESVTIQDKSLSDTIEDIRYQKLRNSGSDTDREIIQNSEKKLKAFIQASILDQELLDTYQIAKGIADDNNFDIPISQIEVTKNHMGIPAEKVIIAGIYSDQVIVDFSYNNSDVTQKYRNNGRSYDYDHYMTLCNYYQDATVEGGEGQHQYIIKLPDTLNHEISSFPIRLNLKIKSKAVPYQNIPYNIIDFAELNVTDVDSIGIEEGERSYINECYNKSISDLTEDSLEIKDITVLDSKGTKWSLSIGLVDYFKSPEHQQIVLQMNNKLYKIDSTNLKLEHVEMDPNSFRYYQPDEQGLQIYHNQPIDKNDVGLVDFRDKSILGFDMEIVDDSLVLSYGNSTIAKVENWSNYQPAREMMFAFNDTMVSNAECIFSACNSEDIIEDFNKEKVTLLKEQMFDAIVRDNINEAKDLIRKIESINIESRHELTPLYVAIQAGRLDIVEILFDRKHLSVKDKDIHPLHWAAQQGNLNIAKFLVDQGADIGAKDNNGRTPLRVAAYSGDLDMVKFFLDRNMNIEVKNNDPYKVMGVVEGVKNEIINQADTAPNVKRWAEFFVEKLRYSIKSVAKEKLKDGMLHNRYSSVNELANEIYKSDGKLFDDIIKEVVDDAYGRVDTKKILSCVHNHGDIGQLISGYIAVFDAMQKGGDLNDNAIFKLASYIKEAMEMKDYPKVPLETRSSLEKLENRLPKSVRNAIFASKVCIKNVYQDEYLYAANKCFNYDNDRRMAFTWTPKNEENNKFRWKIKSDGDNFNIVNAEFNENLYAASDYFNYDNDRRMVFTWVSGGGVARDVWKLGPDGDNCSIMNAKLNEYLYAANYAKYDNDRRRVFTWIPGGQVPQGMWVIEDCGSNVRKVRNADAGSSLDIVKVSRQAQLDHALLNVTKVGNISEVTGLVNQGANVNTEDRDGNTPARNAVLKGHFGIFKYLVENGVSLEGKDHRCGPSICDASYSGNLDILKYLISKCVDINDTDKNGWTPLHFAAWRGYLEVANFLIEKGADINAENIFGRKPIHIAAENNNKDIIDFFLSKGMSIDDTDRDGRTLLYLASWNGHLDIVKYLVDKGADIYIQDKGGKTSLDTAIDQKHDDIVKYLKQVQLNRELLIVAQYGNLNKVEDLVGQGASLGAKYIDGRTLMHCAAYGGKLDVVEYLVVGEKSSLKIKDNSGRIPLHYAAYNGKLDIVEYFIDKEEIDASIKDKSGLTALHYAVWGGYLEVAELLSKRVNVNDTDKNGKAPLHLAIEVGKLNMVELLLNRNASIEAKYNGKTPLNLAVQEGKLDISKLLIDKHAKVTAKGISGEGILHFAAQGGNVDIVKLLLDMSSSSTKINVKDRFYRTPLYFAVQSGNLDVVKLLLDRGANIRVQDILLRRTLLHAAVESNKPEVVKIFLDRGIGTESKDIYGKTPMLLAAQLGNLDAVKLLLDNRANIEAEDNNGWTSVLHAAKESKWDVVRFLISKGAKFNNEITYQGTPLHFAVREGNLDTVKFLIDKGANIESQDDYNNKPLHLAVRVNRLDIVKFLLDKHANIEAKDMDGDIPLELAIQSGYKDIEEVLRQAQLDLDKELLNAAKSGDLDKVKECIKRGAYINTKSSNGRTSLHWAAFEGCLPGVEYLIKEVADINAKDNTSRTPLHYAARNGHLDVVKYFIEEGANFDVKDKDDKTPLDLASWQKHNDVVKYLEEIKEEKDKTVQRKRRHHHGDHSRHHNHLSRKPLAIDLGDQPEIATSSGARPPSWINDLFGWIKGSVGGLFYSRAALSEEASNTASSIPQVDTQFAKASVSNSNFNKSLELEYRKDISNSTGATSSDSTDQANGTGQKQESKYAYNYFTNGGFFRDNIAYVDANLERMHKRQMPVKFEPKDGDKVLEMGDHYLSQADFNGTIMLLDLLIRRITGQKHISSAEDSISLLEAQGYALNITTEFEQVLKDSAIKSGISVTNLSFYPVKMQLTIVEQVRNGSFSKISKILYSSAKEACPEFKQRGKFLAHLRSHLEEVLVEKRTIRLQQKVEQVSKASDQPTSSISRSEILKNLQDIKKILEKSTQDKSAIKSPLYSNIVEDIRENIELIGKNHNQEEEVQKNLRDIHKSCIAICELIQVDCWDSLKHSLSNNLPLSNKYNFKAAYTNLSIVVEVLKLLYDRDLCRTVINSDENISLNEIISLQEKMEKKLKEMQQQQPTQSAANQKDVAKELYTTVKQENTLKSIYDFVLPNRNNIEDNSNLIGPASRLNNVSITGNITQVRNV